MSIYMQTAIEEALAAEALALEPRRLPFLLAGPVVRRAEPDGVWFWFACSQEITACSPRVTVYDSKGKVDGTLASDNGWYPLVPQADLRVARLGERLWVAIVKAQPRSRPFSRGRFYGYELAIGGPNFTTTLAGQGLNVTYAPFELPTFVLANDSGQRLTHGSCRRPGAYGPDAYPAFDAWLTTPQRGPNGRTYRPIADPSRRPSALILTGDQIYADDVALPLFKAVQRLARDVFGYVEQLPTRDGRGSVSVDSYLPPQQGAGPGSASRKELTARPSSPIGFTTDDGEAHLLSFPEYAAMYLLVLNEQLCRDYGVDDGTIKDLAGFPAAVGASRRVLANMATYMVFDDHEITDDWNLDEAWVRGTSNPMARRIIANGLAAYWAFQAWGNDPEQFEPLKAAITGHLAATRNARGMPVAPAAAFDRELYARHWSFVAPTSPPALCVDARTSRAFPAGQTAVLSGANVWPHLRRLAQRHRLRKGAPLLIVLPTPLLAHRSLTKIQAIKYAWPAERYAGDYELYINNPRQRADLIRELRSQLDPPAIVIFSGDVHHGSVVNGLYVGGVDRAAIDSRRGSWGIRVAQVTSSPIKNIKKDAYVDKQLNITDAGNVGESVISQYETLYDTPRDREAVGVRADVAKLDGPLGRRTFVWENHLCVVDIPEVAGGDLKVLFVGAKDGGVKTASTSLSLRNDPRTFEPSSATINKQVAGGRVMRPLALSGAEAAPTGTYLQTAIEDAMEAEPAPGGSVAVALAPAAVEALGPVIEINSTDHLVTTLRALYGSVDAKTRASLIRNNTVVVAWAIVGGDYRTVYTVNGDGTYPSLREAAERLGLTRWQVTPRAEGRGAVGAPGDAEQRMLEAATTNGYRVTKMAVSRPVCPDCREALRDYRHGQVEVREVQFRLPKPPPAPAAPTPKAPPPPASTTKTSTKVAAAAPLLVAGINIALNWLIGSGNEERIRSMLTKLEPRIKQDQATDPTLGVLLVFRYRSGGAGVTPRFETVLTRQGYTQAEAKASWASTPDFQRGPQFSFEFAWVPPVVQPSPLVLRTPFAKVALAQFADQSRLRFQKAEFAQVGGFDEDGRTKTYNHGKVPRYSFLVLEIPKEISYLRPGGGLSNKDVDVARRVVAGGEVPVIMLDGDTPAVTVWPGDELTMGLFEAAAKMGCRIDDKAGALRHHTGIELVRWLPPDQVRVLKIL